MENKKGLEKIFNTLKEKGLMTKYKSYEDYSQARDKRIAEQEEHPYNDVVRENQQAIIDKNNENMQDNENT